MPFGAVMPPVPPDMPPTTLTDCADSDPLIDKAEPLPELSYKAQPVRLTWVLPCNVTAPLALPFRASTQPTGAMGGVATARAEIVMGVELNRVDKRRGWVCWTITSTALELFV